MLHISSLVAVLKERLYYAFSLESWPQPYHTEFPLAATVENIHTVKKTTEALLATSKETGLKVNAEKLSIYSSHNVTTGNK